MVTPNLGYTQVAAPIRPPSLEDPWGVVEDDYFIGGYRSVDDIAARDGIEAERRTEGMLVFVRSNSVRYRLASDLTTWVVDKTSSEQTDVSFVPTVADLRMREGEFDGETILLGGYYTLGDVPSRSLTWYAASTGTDNGGSVFQVTGVPTGRWIHSNGGVLNVMFFGAKGDSPYTGGGTDDYDAFIRMQEAAPPRGCLCIVPSRPNDQYYYLSQAFNLLKPIHLLGRNQGSLAPQQQVATGLLFAEDSAGIIVNSLNTINYTTRSFDPDNPGATFSIIENLNIKSLGGTANVDGVFVRATCELRRLNVFDFPRDDIRIYATAGGGGAVEGNANVMRVINCRVGYAGANGYYVNGTDANVIEFDTCDAVLCGGWGFLDEGFLGNKYDNCHAAGNVTGDYKTTNGSAQHVFTGCYMEDNPAVTEQAVILFPSIVVGGVLAAALASTTKNLTSTCLSIDANGTHRRPLKHTNIQGTKTIRSYLGLGTTAQIAWRMSRGTTIAEEGWHDLLYNDSSSHWEWQSNNSQNLMAFPDGALVSTLRRFAPSLINGYYIGLPGSNVFRGTGTGPPVSGTWVVGDYIENTTIASGQPRGWGCSVAGAPGTWIPDVNWP